MNVDIPPHDLADQLLGPDRHDWFERLYGPPVVGFRIHGGQVLQHEIDWHTHVRAQLVCVESGLLTTRTRRGEWALPPGCAGWMPAGEEHTIALSGPLQGWGLLIAPDACAGLPGHPCVLAISELVQGLALRVAGTPLAQLQAPRQQRLGQVLLDELRDAPAQALHLPMPQDRRLLRIVGRLLADPADAQDLAAWAHWAGLSARSLSRHFRQETGMSFGEWRQQARLAESLRLLHAGHGVGDIAERLGYSSPSAFVTVFGRQYGVPPGRYRQRAREPRRPSARLASPAASG